MAEFSAEKDSGTKVETSDKLSFDSIMRSILTHRQEQFGPTPSNQTVPKSTSDKDSIPDIISRSAISESPLEPGGPWSRNELAPGVSKPEVWIRPDFDGDIDPGISPRGPSERYTDIDPGIKGPERKYQDFAPGFSHPIIPNALFKDIDPGIKGFVGKHNELTLREIILLMDAQKRKNSTP